jgi:NTE family protein
MKTLAIALGAGGARGLAHIAVLEAIDELNVKPVMIAGSSIGSVIGVAYASGMSGKAIRRHVVRIVHDRADLIRRLLGARASPWSTFLRRPLGQNPILLDGDRLCAAFLPDEVPDDFAKLPIPLLLVASDLFTREEVVFTKGPLRPAVAASMAIPGLVRPVEHCGRVLVAEKLKTRPPDLLVRPHVAAFRMLEFLKASAIIRAGERIKEEVKKELAALLGK